MPATRAPGAAVRKSLSAACWTGFTRSNVTKNIRPDRPNSKGRQPHEEARWGRRFRPPSAHLETFFRSVLGCGVTLRSLLLQLAPQETSAEVRLTRAPGSSRWAGTLSAFIFFVLGS